MVADKRTNDIDRYDVIIIGAGLSGLYAASILKQYHTEIRLIVLEARNRVGGRLLTKIDPMVGYVDLGGSYIGPSQRYIRSLIERLGLKTYKINANGDSVYLNEKRRHRHRSDELPAMANKFVELEIRYMLRLIDQMSKELPQQTPWTHPQAERWDRITFGQFLDRHCWWQESKDFISIYIGCCTSCEAYEESLLWTLWYMRQCDGLDTMYNIEDAAQDSKVIGGTQQICQALFREVGGHQTVRLSDPVVQIRHLTEMMEVRTLNGSVYSGRFLIMAVPPAVQQKIHFEPGLPPIYHQMLQKFSMGSAIKCIVYYREAFWRQQSLNGNMVINCPGTAGPITYTLDDTKPDGSYPAIVGFIIGDRARKMLTRTREERMRFICESYARAFESDEALDPVHYEEMNWMSEQYTGGCFTGLGAPGFLTNYGRLLTEPLFDGHLFLAGTETSLHWAGYMDGALQAAERAAVQVLKRLDPKLKIAKQIENSEKSTTTIMATSTTDCHRAEIQQRDFMPSINQLLTLSSIAVALLGSIIMASF